MFRQRITLKNLNSGAQVIVSFTKSFCQQAQVAKPQIKLNKVLIVSKLSRFEFEKNKHKTLSDKELEDHLKRRGTDYDKLLHHHKLHKAFETTIVNAFKKNNVQVEIANRYSYTKNVVDWADVIIPTGGDGTFLLAASKINDNNKPIIGLNSDPTRSEGYLCLPKHYSTKIEEVIEKLKTGAFKWLMRSRIRVSLQGEKGIYKVRNMHSVEAVDDVDEVKNISIELKGKETPTRLPSLALNEVFIGESVSARVSSLEMWLNDDPTQTILKCSGLLLATGTGSTAWHRSINRIPVQIVAELLRLLDFECTEGKDSLATVLADIYNKKLVFDPSETQICYTIRDIISAGVWPQPKGIKSRGFAPKVKVKSHCFDASLVIDGGIAYPFNDGVVAELSMHPEDALRTVTLHD